MDLIYGHPLLSNEKWKQNVEKVIAFNIPHISCYALTVEPKTPLHKMIKEKKKEDIQQEKQAEQFLFHKCATTRPNPEAAVALVPQLLLDRSRADRDRQCAQLVHESWELQES